MVIKNYRDVKKRAYHALGNNPGNLSKTVLLYGGIPALLSLVLTGLELLANNASTGGGLESIQNYGLISTAFSVIQLAGYVFLLFWSPGIGYSGLQVMRGEDPFPGLFQGFRKWKPLLRYMSMFFVVFFTVYMFIGTGITMAVVMAWMFFTMLTTSVPQTPEEMDAFMQAMSESPSLQIVVYIAVAMILLVILVLYTPLSYKLRMVNLLIMDKNMGALEAIITSFRQTKGSCLQLFCLDLSFWWYHLLTVVCTGISFLPLLPVFSAMNQNTVTIVFSLIDCAATLGLYLLGIMKINTANAAAYIHLCPVEEDHDI